MASSRLSRKRALPARFQDGALEADLLAENSKLNEKRTPPPIPLQIL